jgi:arylsulfatase A-like enzyme
MNHLKLLTLALLAVLAGCANQSYDVPAIQTPTQHVLIVVMDGLRRDSITADQMPTLYALAQQGVFFNAHHPVYPSSTQVNGAALATGQRPQTSNVIANREYRPDLELLQPIDMNDEYYSWKADRETKGGFVHAATLPELARAQGRSTVVAGTKAVAILWDRSLKKRSATQPTLYEGHAIPFATLDPIIENQGPFPPGVDQKAFINERRDIWTTRALTEVLWKDQIPNLTVLWLYEPDFTQHGVGVGAKNAKLALKSSDDRLKTVLNELEKRGLREHTDIIVASDHGFSTVYRKVDVGKDLRDNGKFKAEGSYKKPPEKGNILITGLGGSMGFNVIGHDEEVRRKLITFLQNSNWAGVIFTRDGFDGTFKLSDINIETPEAFDVIVSMKWKDEKSEHGTPGVIVADGPDKGQGMHVSLCKYDMANTLIASGPSFKKGVVNNLPSGNSDVAPTVAHIMGLKTEKPMEGRILVEALANGTAPNIEPKTTFLRAQRKLKDDKGAEKTWNQYLKITRFAGRSYFDEGNTGVPPSEH